MTWLSEKPRYYCPDCGQVFIKGWFVWRGHERYIRGEMVICSPDIVGKKLEKAP